MNRLWLCSTSFPVLAGTLCAIAIMFNICAVCRGWYEIVDFDGITSTQSQPAWAVALTAISLALATTAYLVLLLTMMFKRDSARGFTVTILGWFAAAAILFGLIGVAIRQHPIVQPRQSLQYTQNFFYGILAAGIYILIAILLAIYTASARYVHLGHEDRRTVECTSIILRTINFAVFLLVGATVYSTVEGWALVDALYFTDYSLLTIGLGNMVPQTHLGRSLLFPYAAGGTISLGLVISSITSFAKNMTSMKLRFELQKAQDHIHESRNSGEPIDSTHNNDDTQSPHVPDGSQFPRRREVLRLYHIKSTFYRRRRIEALVFFSLAWFVLWLASAGIFRRSERSQGWSYFEALYFTYISLTTIGYGDLYPTSNFGRAFFVFWSLLAVPVLTNLVTAFGEIGCQTFFYSSRHLWRFCASRAHARQDHRRGLWRSNGATPSAHYLEILEGDIDIGKHAQGRLMTGQQPQDSHITATRSGSAANELKLSKSMHGAVQRKLLLAEEMETLVTALRDEPVGQGRYQDWSRILSLLHDNRDEDSNSLEPMPPAATHSHAQFMARRVVSPENALAERNTEILWMLKLLAEKLCLVLREELNGEIK